MAERSAHSPKCNKRGLIRHLGVNAARRIAEAQSIAPVVCVKFHNIAHRQDDSSSIPLANRGAYVPAFHSVVFTTATDYPEHPFDATPMAVAGVAAATLA
jgi:hypothetical protein